MWDVRVGGLVVQIGAIVAFTVALIHPTGSVQIGGRDGMVLQSWVVLLAAPVVVVAAAGVKRWARSRTR